MEQQEADYKPLVQESEANPFTLKQLMPTIKDYGIFVLKFSWLLVMAGCFLGWYMRNKKMDTPTTYTANLSFKMDESVGAAQQGIASLFGGAVAEGESSLMSLKSLKEIIKTRQVVQKTLFDKKNMRYHKGGEDYLINHYLRLFFYKEGAQNPYYFTTDSIDPYNRKANKLIMYVHRVISNNFITVDITPANIVNMRCNSQNEDFSFELLTSMYNQLDSFYSDDKIQRKEAFYDMAVKRKGDLWRKLRAAESDYIIHVNTNGAEAPGRYNTAIKTQYLSTDLRSATEAYFMALRNEEAAWVVLEKQRQNRALQMIDQPLYPLRAEVPNPFLHMVIGFVAGFVLSLLAVLGLKFVLNYFNNQSRETTTEVV